jgi:lipid-A-disaccharide synthase
VPRLLISAAEASGDLLGAELVRALPDRESWEIRGVAGPAMRAAGVTALARTEDLSVMGVVEVLGHLGTIRRIQAKMISAMDEGADAIVLIDAPDLHLPLGRAAQARDLVAIGYVSPQIWAWRPGRSRDISKVLDQLLCLFDFEPELYPDLNTTWVGHPVLDRLPARQPVDANLFALLPGSRQQEIDRLRPIFLETAARIRAHRPSAHFLLIGPPPPEPLPPWIQATPSIAEAAHARAALTKAGTVTLELAVMGVPQVVAHQVHPVTYGLGRLLVRGIHHIAMPNILAKRLCIPEFLQQLSPDELAVAVLELPEVQPVELGALGAPGASARAAAAVARAVGAP